jgi:carbon storage regulator
MLVLSRKIGEQIVIDGCIRVTIVEVKGNKVRLGLEAPPHVSIDREEIRDRRQAFECETETAADLELVAT